MRKFKIGRGSGEHDPLISELFRSEFENLSIRQGNGWLEDSCDAYGGGKGCGYKYGSHYGDFHVLHNERYPFELIQYWSSK